MTGNGHRDYLRIATEEAFAPPEVISEWRGLLERGDIDPGFASLWGFFLTTRAERPQNVVARLQDLGERRLSDMDFTGIDKQIISLTAPGTQIFDTDRATGIATLANDQLADACRAHPDRFAGLTAVAPQDPDAAAKEIERGVTQLGFNGVIINSHTHGEYLDNQKFWPILEAAEAQDVPIYLHPNTPSRGLIGPIVEQRLDGAIYGFAVETGLHLLRMIVAGVFDRFPRLRLVVGHLGEALPFWLYRLDYMYASRVSGRGGQSVELLPSEYLKRNVWITTSGMAWEPAIQFTRQVLGGDRVMYAMDYPYEFEADEVRTHDELALTAGERRELFQGIAERVFKLDTAAAKG
ncbi:MAG: amidohydrolase family protein [Pseudonocardiaceae bacterium]|nr:amidohydrolase family protein [Pseudonocardiaceae bacterium]